MRTVATPGATFGSLVRAWQRTSGRPCASWRYASRSNAFSAETSAPLPDFIEALAPLGMPDVRCDPRRSHRGWVPRARAATNGACSWACPIVINVAWWLSFTAQR